MEHAVYLNTVHIDETNRSASERHNERIPSTFFPMASDYTRHRAHLESIYNRLAKLKSQWPSYEDTAVEDSEAVAPRIVSVDLNKTVNAEAHHTAVYDVEQVVLRRGQKFSLSLTFDAPVDFSQFDVTLVLLTGRTPVQSKGTLTRLLLSADSKNASAARKKWSVQEVKDGSTRLDVELAAPASALIGRYEVAVEVVGKGNASEYRKKMESSFYMVFNPWCEDDLCYLPGEEEREEYVMNETGRIFVGSAERKFGKPWVFGQFDKVSFETALYILSTSQISDTAMGNPVIITRVLSKMINNNDDNGILVGNWSGDYAGGAEPTDWISSTAILEKYMATKKPVKYGQCWVFSGLFTTLMRTLGLPARSITNFESAHDSDYSMTIDRFWDEEGKSLSDYNDSIWNFHVWNEAFYKREDLPDGYDGWQAVDATPQEPSEGVMQCGPAPVRAIKDGAVFLAFDTKFIFAEVNGDIIEWTMMKNGDVRPEHKDGYSVGKYISTKSVSSNRRNDVTDEYKFRDGSDLERATVRRAAKHSSKKDELLDFYDIPDAQKVEFSLKTVGDKSGDWKIILDMKNTTSDDLTVTAHLSAKAVSYIGLVESELRDETREVKVAGNSSTDIVITMIAADYLNKLKRDATVNVFCRAKVQETGQLFFKKDNFFIDRPELQLHTSKSVAIVDEKVELTVEFKNDLAVDLTNCSIQIQGPGIMGSRSVKVKGGVVRSGDTMEETVAITPRLPGNREIIAQLNCSQLQNITGVTSITVRK